MRLWSHCNFIQNFLVHHDSLIMVKKTAQKCTSVADEVASPATAVASQEGGMDVVASPSYTGLPDAKRTNKAPTVQDIIVDPITQLASEHWSSQKKVHYTFYRSILSTLLTFRLCCLF